MPDRLTVCGALGSLSLTISEPVMVCTVAGVNMTLMLQVPRGGTAADPQLSISLKLPDTTTLFTVRLLILLVFLRVTVLLTELVFSCCVPKLRLEGERLTACA